MRRRKFGSLAGTSLLATAIGASQTSAQSTSGSTPDPSLLTTTLTPLGGERAGNADGSIPAWNGGINIPNAPDNDAMFSSEQPLVVIDANNMAQYQNYLTPGMMALMTTLGFSIKVYPTHRTAAAPQYVYDNTAKNVTISKLNVNGGRFGFTGAYGGVPFPIPDVGDPFAAGAQLIWNHLTTWPGFCVSGTSSHSGGFIVVNGRLVMTAGGPVKFKNYFYDPNGSLETFGGYFEKNHLWSTVPASAQGQETIIWLSVNVQVKPNLIWQLINGQGRVREAPDVAFDTPNGNGISNYDENTGFFGSPEQYDWRFIEKKELYVPYNGSGIRLVMPPDFYTPKFPNPDVVRFEKHRVWVVEATLHPGRRNVLARRRFYIDEDTWQILWGDCYDGQGRLAKIEMCYNRVVPSLPGTINLGFVNFDMISNNYGGTIGFGPPYAGQTDFHTYLPDSVFDPQQMAAQASF